MQILRRADAHRKVVSITGIVYLWLRHLSNANSVLPGVGERSRVLVTLETIPSFGPVCSAGIIAEIGHAQRFAYDEATVAWYAGLHGRQQASGAFKAQATRLTKRGNAHQHKRALTLIARPGCAGDQYGNITRIFNVGARRETRFLGARCIISPIRR